MSIENKRMKRKAQRKASRKYIGAWIESKFGYYITGFFSFIKQQIKRVFEMKYLALIGIVLIFIFGMFIYLQSEQYFKAKDRYDYYHPKVKTSEKEFNQSADRVDETRSELSNVTSSQTKVIKNADDLISDLAERMYQYDSQDVYDSNRKDAKKLFKNDKIPENIYGTGYDKSDESIIDNLDMTSQLEDVAIYNTDKENKSGKTLKLKAIVSYKSNIEGTSNENASHKHDIVYDIKVDAESNKISDIKKAKTLKAEYEVE